MDGQIFDCNVGAANRPATELLRTLHASAASTSSDIRHHRWVLFTPPLPLPPQTSDIIDGSSSRLHCLYLLRHPTSSMGPLHALPLPSQTSDIIDGSSSRLRCFYLRRHPTSSMGPLHASAASTSADIRHHRWVASTAPTISDIRHEHKYLFTPPLPLPSQTSNQLCMLKLIQREWNDSTLIVCAVRQTEP
ncbi:hypothetical protein CF319_g9472 [Tilletia indica]|nr:hypothetical protein CF319_g9472 [Tilletia indica]